jgi:FixJ family two-component response regulator
MISIVDDDASVREAMKGLVRSLGYDAAAFGSAEEFLDSDRLRETACLITDVQMPGRSGLELQDYLTENGHTMPVIVVTALAEEAIRGRALLAGAFGFFRKPFHEDGLIECLDRAVTASAGLA